MAFKSLIIFALVASVGRVMAAPLVASHLGTCQGIRCARHTIDGGRSDLSRRLANFDGNNVTLSSASPDPLPTSVDPSSTLSVNPSSTPSVDPSFTFSVNPSLTSSVDGLPTETPEPTISHSHGHKHLSSISGEIPQATDSAAGDVVTITVISTVILNPTDPAASLPTQSPASSGSVVSSSSLATDPSSTVLGNPSATPPAGGIDYSSGLIQPSGIFTSVSSPAPSVSPTIIELTDSGSSTSVSSSSTDQPTPSPTPSGIIFLPPS